MQSSSQRYEDYTEKWVGCFFFVSSLYRTSRLSYLVQEREKIRRSVSIVYPSRCIYSDMFFFSIKLSRSQSRVNFHHVCTVSLSSVVDLVFSQQSISINSCESNVHSSIAPSKLYDVNLTCSREYLIEKFKARVMAVLLIFIKQRFSCALFYR
jgi:hypothetical protein